MIASFLAVQAAAAQIKSWPEDGQLVCDVQADLFLGIEDCPGTIRLHQVIIARDPQNALAHYHLGFAYGMLGNHRKELAEYGRAVELGLIDWTLFLNLGLVHFEQGDFKVAEEVLRVAVLLAPGHSESHYNLALTYERMQMLSQAEQEALIALARDPRDPDIGNTVAVVFAERGDYARARAEWSALLTDDPTYEPAKTNLAILDHAKVRDANGTARQLASTNLGKRAAPRPATATIGVH